MYRAFQSYSRAFDQLITVNQQITEQYCEQTVGAIRRVIELNKANFALAEDMKAIQNVQNNRYEEIKVLYKRHDPALKEAYDKLTEITVMLSECQDLILRLQKAQGIQEQTELLHCYVQYRGRFQQYRRYQDLRFFKNVCTELDLYTKQTLYHVSKAFSEKMNKLCQKPGMPSLDYFMLIVEEVKLMQPAVLLTRYFDIKLYNDLKMLITSQLHCYLSKYVGEALPAVLIPQSVLLNDYCQIFAGLRTQSLVYSCCYLANGETHVVQGECFLQFTELLLGLICAAMILNEELSGLFPYVETRILCAPHTMIRNVGYGVPVPSTMCEFLGLVFSFMCSPMELRQYCAAVPIGSSALLRETCAALKKDYLTQDSTQSVLFGKLRSYTQTSPPIALYSLGVFDAFLTVFQLPVFQKLKLVAELGLFYFAPARAFVAQAAEAFFAQYAKIVSQYRTSIYQSGVARSTVYTAQFIQDSLIIFLHGRSCLCFLSETTYFYVFSAIFERANTYQAKDVISENQSASPGGMRQMSLPVDVVQPGRHLLDYTLRQTIAATHSLKSADVVENHNFPPPPPNQREKSTGGWESPTESNSSQLAALFSYFYYVSLHDFLFLLLGDSDANGKQADAYTVQALKMQAQVVPPQHARSKSFQAGARGTKVYNSQLDTLNQRSAAYGLRQSVLNGEKPPISAEMPTLVPVLVQVVVEGLISNLEGSIAYDKAHAEKYGDLFRALNVKFTLDALFPALHSRAFAQIEDRLASIYKIAVNNYAEEQLLRQASWMAFLKRIEATASTYQALAVPTRPGTLKTDAERVCGSISHNVVADAKEVMSRFKKYSQLKYQHFSSFAQKTLATALTQARTAVCDVICAKADECYQRFTSAIHEYYGGEISVFPPEKQVVHDAFLGASMQYAQGEPLKV